jgi:hypothetical protein
MHALARPAIKRKTGSFDGLCAGETVTKVLRVGRLRNAP